MSANISIISNPESPFMRRVRASSASSDSSLQKPKHTKSPRKTSSLPSETVEYLKNWMMCPDHITHPYPTEQEKSQIMAETGIELKQLTNWFVNNRKRYWKPRIEARLQKQAQVQAVSVATAPQVSPSKSDLRSKGAPYISLDMTQQPHRVSVTSYDDNDCFHVVNSEALATFDRSGSPRAVSVGSDSVSAVSESDNSASEMDDDFNSGDVVDEVDSELQTVKRNEHVDIHILRPFGQYPFPTMEDVTVLSDVPSNRIMRSYRNCVMSYRIPFEGFGEQKKAQSRRDAQIVKIKKQFLKRFIAETAAAAAGPPTAPKTQEVPPKRSRTTEADEAETHRPKYLRKCTSTWRDACRTATDGYDRELPSLEEASHLFGYSEQ